MRNDKQPARRAVGADIKKQVQDMPECIRQRALQQIFKRLVYGREKNNGANGLVPDGKAVYELSARPSGTDAK